MLSERPWKLEAVVALLTGLILGWCALNLSALGVTQLALHKSSANRLVEFIISTFSFHVIALVLLHFFVRYHGARWSDLFGFRKFRLRAIAGAAAAAGLVLPVAWGLQAASALLLTKLGGTPVEQTSIKAL